MPSVFPGALDNIASNKTNATVSDTDHPDHHNKLADAINAVQSALGTNLTNVKLADGDKGDITVSASGTTWTIDNSVVTYAKIQNVSATDRLLGRSTAGAGVVQEIVCTAAGRALIDDVDAAAQRTTLGLGGAALLNVGTTAGTVAAGNDSRFTTNLSYTASTRVLASSTGSSATLPVFTSTAAGLVSGSGGGTTNFLRADGTWAAPAGGGSVVVDDDSLILAGQVFG